MHSYYSCAFCKLLGAQMPQGWEREVEWLREFQEFLQLAAMPGEKVRSGEVLDHFLLWSSEDLKLPYPHP